MVVSKDHPVCLIEREHEKYLLKQGMARSFYGQLGYAMLQKAQEHGDILTLPEFLQALYLSSFQGTLTEVPFTVQTEEIIGKSRQGNPVAIVVHGQGILTSKRIRNGSILEEIEDEAPNHGLTRTKSGRGQFALPLYDYEVHALLEGHILPIFSYDNFKKGISALPREYAVVRDFHPRKEVPSGHHQYLNTLKEIPRVISLVGGIENLENCLDMLTFYHGIKKLNYSHPLHHLDLEQPQGRFVEVHGINNLLYSHMQMDGPARFISVKRENLQEKIDKDVVVEVS